MSNDEIVTDAWQARAYLMQALGTNLISPETTLADAAKIVLDLVDWEKLRAKCPVEFHCNG